MSEQQDVWCSRCWGDHYTNDCPHKQAAEEENRLFELEEAEEEKKRALESEAEIARLKQLNVELVDTHNTHVILVSRLNERAEAAEAELDLKAQDNDKLRSVLQGVIKTARRRGAELADTRKALERAIEHITDLDAIYFDGERIDNVEYWLKAAKESR
jgi:hypothetical protein